MIGASRSCDIRVPELHRREMEFVFRPGFGVKLIPIHRKHQVLIDRAINQGRDYALHGTVLDIRGRSCASVCLRALIAHAPNSVRA